jgi:hypothetical protein
MCTVKTYKCFEKLNSLINTKIEILNYHNHKPFKFDKMEEKKIGCQ